MIRRVAAIAIADLFRLFVREELYDLGYADAVEAVNLHRDVDRDTGARVDAAAMVRQLAYVQGYAHACRLSCEYLTPPWEVADTVGRVAGVLAAMVESTADDTSHTIRVVDTFRRELDAAARARREWAPPAK